VSTTERVLETRLVAAGPAPVPGAVPLGHRFTVGGVLGKTLAVWWRHVLPFTALSVVVYSPFAVTFGMFWSSVVRQGRTPGSGEPGKLAVAVAAISLVTVVLAVVQAGAVTYGTVRHLSGERARFGDMVRAGLRRGLPVVGVGVVLWFATVLGLVLLVVPGILLMVAASVAIPAAVVERPGVGGAIRRSFQLTRGRRWAVFAAGLTTLVAVWVLTAAVQLGATVLASTLLPPQQAPLGVIVSSQLGNVLFSALPLVGIAVAYHELRVEKEGVDTAALAKVFE
jgi:hypothetical protein